MSKNNARERVEKLFSEMQQPVSEPNGNTPGLMPAATTPSGAGVQLPTPSPLLWELEALRKRVQELETQLNEQASKKLSASVIYEKERSVSLIWMKR